MRVMSLRSWRSARRRIILRAAFLRLVVTMRRLPSFRLRATRWQPRWRVSRQACALLIGESEELCCGSFSCLLIGRLDDAENLQQPASTPVSASEAP
jgi:hypothetical protein